MKYQPIKWTVERGNWARYLRHLRQHGHREAAKLLNKSMKSIALDYAQRLLQGTPK